MISIERRGKVMDNQEFSAVLKVAANKRYEYFIKKVVDREEVWGLYDNGWAVTEDDYGNKMIPFWPRKEFAQNCIQDTWENYEPEKIDLYEFIDEWLPNMKEDGLKPSIFWNNHDSAVVNIDILLEDLNRELENY